MHRLRTIYVKLLFTNADSNFNLKTDKYASRFIDAYGRDKIEKEKLKLISAIEAFG